MIPNGINISRITPESRQRHDEYTFLAFAGRHVQKRVDLLLLAAEKLIKKGICVKVVIVDENSPSISEKVFGSTPYWLNVVKPREDVNSLFAMADCFVSTSAHETFSYAIAEAEIFGLPVIQSDIEGTMWNSANPSAFLFKSESVEDLERMMIKVMNISTDVMDNNCKITAKNIIQDYSLESWADKVIDFFSSIP